MVLLDNFRNNMCVWRCLLFIKEHVLIVVLRWQSSLRKVFFKSDLVPRTCLDELDKVEGYLNKRKQFNEWTGIRVYELEWQENG